MIFTVSLRGDEVCGPTFSYTASPLRLIDGVCCGNSIHDVQLLSLDNQPARKRSVCVSVVCNHFNITSV